MKDSNRSKLSPQEIAKIEARMIGSMAEKPKILLLTSKLKIALIIGVLLTLTYFNMKRNEDNSLNQQVKMRLDTEQTIRQ